MNAIKNIPNFYFVGIGGIGMSALARYLKLLGKQVSGYDKTSTTLTNALIREGIDVSFIDSEEEINCNDCTPENTLVIYTPAIPKDNIILNFFKTEGYTIVKRARLLGEVTKNSTCLAVAGTHGKTTTSAILGHLLAACDMPVTAFLGGIAENYNSNFISNGTEITVVEADEFDRSFLQLAPDIACITSMDADHLDIYGDNKSLEDSFAAFASLLPEKDRLLVKKGLPLEGTTIAVMDTADFEAQRVTIADGAYVFDLKTPEGTIPRLRFSLPGHHNLCNAVTALAMAIMVGTPKNLLAEALQSFNGVKRRFSFKIRQENLVLIDDYAHHPTEINALFQAVSEMYPDDKKLIVFQPHLFSRTRDFMDDFAESLAQFDEVYVLAIYPARELPIEGITSDLLCRKISEKRDKSQHKAVALITKKSLSETIQQSPCKIKLLVGAGDIGAEVEKVTKYIQDEG